MNIKRIVLSQDVPNEILICGNLKILPHKRMSFVQYPGINMFTNSLLVEYSPKFEKEFRDWLLFHSFILNDSFGIIGYNNLLSSDVTEAGELSRQTNFNDLTKLKFTSLHCSKSDFRNKSYIQLYNAYLETNQEEKNAIRNTMIKLETGGKFNQPNILDSSFWQLMPAYSVIEFIIGKQEHCTIKHTCSSEDCSFYNINIPSHNKRTYLKNIETYFISRSMDVNIIDKYLEIIKLVYVNLRNYIVHNSLMPLSSHLEQQNGTTITHDLEKIKQDLLVDATSLLSLTYILNDIARILLLDRLFNTGSFPDISPLKSTSIISS